MIELHHFKNLNINILMINAIRNTLIATFPYRLTSGHAQN